MEWEKIYKWTVNTLVRGIFGFAFLYGSYVVVKKMLWDGLTEGDLVKSIVGAVLTGIIVPIITMIFMFFFRKGAPTDTQPPTQ